MKKPELLQNNRTMEQFDNVTIEQKKTPAQRIDWSSEII
jgi:hypothetical protein